jgi:hypothetical protein
MHDELIRHIEEATDDAYRILGEIGTDPSRLGFIALERETGALVALSLVGDDLHVLERLDAAVPTDGSRCATCRAALPVWVDACPSCGARIVGDELPGAATAGAREILLDEVRSASAGEYEVLGVMDGALGSVYFARETARGRLVALALQAEDEEDDAVSLTSTWLAPDGTPADSAAAPAPRPVPVIAADPFPIPDPEPRPSWVRRLLALAGLAVILLIVIAYVRGAPEPAATSTHDAAPAADTR